MKYKKKKYFKQALDLNKLILNIDFFFVFQLKAVNVSNWVLLKKNLSKHDLKFKIYSTKLLKKTDFFNVKSSVIENLHTGKILIVYSKEKSFYMNSLRLKTLLPVFDNNSFLVFLYVFFFKGFFSPEKFKNLLNICLINSKIEFTYLILQKYINFLKLCNKKLVNQINV